MHHQWSSVIVVCCCCYPPSLSTVIVHHRCLLSLSAIIVYHHCLLSLSAVVICCFHLLPLSSVIICCSCPPSLSTVIVCCHPLLLSIVVIHCHPSLPSVIVVCCHPLLPSVIIICRHQWWSSPCIIGGHHPLLCIVGGHCYNPPQFFSHLSDPLLITLPSKPMAKRPLPLNPSPLPELPLLPPSKPSKPSSPLDQPPVEPLVPVPWNIHHQEYSSMETYQEPPPVENPLEDPDSPMEDAPPLEPEPVTHYEPDTPGGCTKTLSSQESPIAPWEEYLTQPSSPVSRKHSLSPTSPSSAPIQQYTSCEGSYQSITPSASSPIAGTLPQSPGHQSTSSGGSADNPSSMQSSTDDADSNMALNWVTINTDYLKG